MDAAVALQRKKTIKFLCIVDFSLSKQGVFFVTLRHKTVMKKMSQSFFFAVSLKIGGFANQFLDTVLQCCPAIFGRFAHLDAHFFCRFLEFGRGVGNLFEKKQNKSCYFQNVFNFLAADFSLAAGIFYFFRQFSVCFQVFHFIPIITRRISTMSIIIGIDHGYYAIKTAHCSFPARLTSYGEHEPCGCLSFTIFLCLIADLSDK